MGKHLNGYYNGLTIYNVVLITDIHESMNITMKQKVVHIILLLLVRDQVWNEYNLLMAHGHKAQEGQPQTNSSIDVILVKLHLITEQPFQSPKHPPSFS